MFLKVKGLQKSFSGTIPVKALKGVSFSVDRGEHLFVVGETGSGKSTLLRCLSGISTLDGGSVTIDEKSLVGPEGQLIPGDKRVKLVDQQLNLKNYNTVLQNIEWHVPVGLLVREKQALIKRILDVFELSRLKNKKPIELSGGQQQRVAIACALVNIPPLLLMDEPFAHFDPQLKSRVFSYINAIIEAQNTTVVTVTHDYMETLKHASRVLVLNKGKKVQWDTPVNCYHLPANDYTAGLLGEYSIYHRDGVDYLIRPEEWRIDPLGSINANVRKVSFCGHYYEVECVADNGQCIILNTTEANSLSKETTVLLSSLNWNRKINDKGRVIYGS